MTTIRLSSCRRNLPPDWQGATVSRYDDLEPHPRGLAVPLFVDHPGRAGGDCAVALFEPGGRHIASWCGGDDFTVRWIDDGGGLLLFGVRHGRRHELVLRHVAFPSLEELGRCELPFPGAGLGGFELVPSPGGRYASLFLYSGQSELGFELFSVRPELARIASLPYVFGVNDLTPTVFSPDDRFLALAVREDSLWWAADADDPDWDTPASGAALEWARIYICDLDTRAISEHPLVVDLPAGWVGEDEELGPEELRFVSPRELGFRAPWGGEVTLHLPLGERTFIPPPEAPLR